MTGVRRALAISLVERHLLIVIALASNVILARLLTPEQIGVYSVSLAVIGIAQVMRDFGIGNFLIQAKELHDSHVQTAFGLSLMVGGGLFVVVYAGAPWAGSYYAEPRMVDTLRISALNFLVLPFCSISLALLRRDMRFQRILYVTLAATVVGFVVTVLLAALGWGANSMAVGSVVTNVATGFGTWLARDDRRFLLPNLRHWRELTSFGAQSSTANIVTTVSMDINDLVLGKLLGFAPVALVSRAQGLMNLFHRDIMGAIRNVAFPAFAQAHRAGMDVEAQYVKGTSMVCVVGWPFYGFVALFALEVLRLLFGPQWDAAVALVPLFCLAGTFGAAASLVNSAMLAVGRIDVVTRGELIFAPVRAATIVGAVVATGSMLGCAVAFAATYALYLPFIYRLKERALPNDLKALKHGLWVSAKVTTMALVGPAALAGSFGLDRQAPVGLPGLLAAAALCIAGWLVGLHLFRHPLAADPAFLRLTSRLTGLLGKRHHP